MSNKNKLSLANNRTPPGILLFVLFFSLFASSVFAYVFKPGDQFGIDFDLGGHYQKSFIKGSQYLGVYDIDGIRQMPGYSDYGTYRLKVYYKFDFGSLSLRQQAELDLLPNERRIYAIDGQIEMSSSAINARYGWCDLTSTPFMIYGDPINYVVTTYGEGVTSGLPVRSVSRWYNALRVGFNDVPGSAIYATKIGNAWLAGLMLPLNIIDQVKTRVQAYILSEGMLNTAVARKDYKVMDVSGTYAFLRNVKFGFESAYSLYMPDLGVIASPEQGNANQIWSKISLRGIQLKLTYNDINRKFFAPIGFVKNSSYQDDGFTYSDINYGSEITIYRYGMILNNRSGGQADLTLLVPKSLSLFLYPMTIEGGYEYYQDKEAVSLYGSTKYIYKMAQINFICSLPFIGSQIGYAYSYGNVNRPDDQKTSADNEKIDLVSKGHEFDFTQPLLKFASIKFRWMPKQAQRGYEKANHFSMADNRSVDDSVAVDRNLEAYSLGVTFKTKAGNFFLSGQKLDFTSLNSNEAYSGYSAYFAFSVRFW